MKETFNEVIWFLKNPILEKDKNININYRIKKLFYLLVISIISALLLSIPLIIIESLGFINTDKHAVAKLIKNNSLSFIFISAVIVAPLTEELIFRAPITTFKNNTNFKFIFYIFTIIFGLVHLFNYNITTKTLLLSPFLIAPQIILGGYLGFIRVRFGLIWSILLHLIYNGIFIGISLLAQNK